MSAMVKLLLGKVLRSAVEDSEDHVTFETADGEKYVLYHEQDCCESVYLESVVGDLSDLVGEPILMAELVTSSIAPPGAERPEAYDYDGNFSCTWSFYKFATRKGYVDIRWVGVSNGYYSETVSLGRINDRGRLERIDEEEE